MGGKPALMRESIGLWIPGSRILRWVSETRPEDQVGELAAKQKHRPVNKKIPAPGQMNSLRRGAGNREQHNRITAQIDQQAPNQTGKFANAPAKFAASSEQGSSASPNRRPYAIGSVVTISMPKPARPT
jgi:hypothetical protein